LVDYRLGLTSKLRLTNPVAHQHRALADGRHGLIPKPSSRSWRGVR